MEPWALIITALGGMTGLAGLVTSVATARQSARKNELDALRETINELQEENKRMRDIMAVLQDENMQLRVRINELDAENEQLRKKLGMAAFRKPLKGLATRDDTH